MATTPQHRLLIAANGGCVDNGSFVNDVTDDDDDDDVDGDNDLDDDYDVGGLLTLLTFICLMERMLLSDSLVLQGCWNNLC